VGRGKEPDSLTWLSMELLISSRAEADLTSAVDWYQKKGADLGGDFVRCVDATISLIHRSPQIFRKRHGPVRMAMAYGPRPAMVGLWVHFKPRARLNLETRHSLLRLDFDPSGSHAHPVLRSLGEEGSLARKSARLRLFSTRPYRFPV